MCMLYLKTSYTSASICTNEVVISCSNFPCDCGSGIQNGTLIQALNEVRVKLLWVHSKDMYGSESNFTLTPNRSAV